MIQPGDERGISLPEALVSLLLLVAVMSSFGGFLVQSTKINKSRQMAVETQATARNCLSLIVNSIRSAGWDPHETGFSRVNLDSDWTDSDDYIEVQADLDDDGTIDSSVGEQIRVRWIADRLEWRRSSGGAWEILGVNVTNDADGDGNREQMFTPIGSPPTAITVTITTESPAPDPQTGRILRYTVSSDVILRDSL